MHSLLRGVVARTIAITPSGALSPGPLSSVAVVSGVHLGFMGGIYVALGHMIAEVAYLLVLWKALDRVRGVTERVEKPLNTAIALFMVYFAYLIWTDVASGAGPGMGGVSPAGSPLEAIAYGVIFTGLNAHFLLWWLTVGFPILKEASRHGITGFAVMYSSHVWIDYAWLALLAGMGGLVAGLAEAYRLVMILVMAMLLLFAADVTARTWLGRRILPF